MDIRMSNIASPMPQIRAKFTNKLGIPLSGCKVYTYEPNSDIPKTTWLDIDKTAENTNPILLDAAGEADIFLDGLYRVVVKDRFGFVVYDVEKTGSTQQQINDFTGNYWYAKPLGYELNARVMLTNGDIVKSTVPNNITNPNIDMTGWKFNDNTVESIADLLAIQNPKDGQTVRVTDAQGGTFVYRASKALINDGVVTFFGWTRASFMFLTLRMGGAIGDGITGEWANINKVLRYGFENNLTVDGEGLTYLTSALFIDSNLYLKNAKFKNSTLDQNMISVFTTDENPDTWIENVTFENVHIDGRRSDCTGLPSGAFDEDGGRHGFRFVKKCRNIRFIDSGADNCCVDGAIFYAKGALQGAWSHFTKGVTFEGKCHFSNNGRWGISADSVDGMTFGDGMKANGNGLSLVQGANITTGLSARLHEGKEYGGAVDIEEYRGDAYSRNIIFGKVDFTKNAGGSVCFTRTGAITYPTHNVYFRSGGLFDNGISLNKHESANYALNFAGYSTTSTENSYRGIFIDGVDLGGGDVLFVGTNASSVSNIHNQLNVFLTLSVVSFDKKYQFVLNDSFSNYEYMGAYTDKLATWVGNNTKETKVRIHNNNALGSKASIQIWDGGIGSGLEFEKSDGGYDLHFLNGENTILTFRKYGSIIPAVDNIAQVGESGKRFTTIHLVSAPIVSSDAKYKTDVRDITEVEKLIALDLRKNIKSYRLISNQDKIHIGLIAQEVVAIFAEHGLDANDYNLISYEGDSYAIRYEELILFILSAI